MHTVNHFEHLKANNPSEALRVHPYIVNHLRLSEDRIEQALEMLKGYPDVEEEVKPEIGEFTQRLRPDILELLNLFYSIFFMH